MRRLEVMVSTDIDEHNWSRWWVVLLRLLSQWIDAGKEKKREDEIKRCSTYMMDRIRGPANMSNIYSSARPILKPCCLNSMAKTPLHCGSEGTRHPFQNGLARGSNPLRTTGEKLKERSHLESSQEKGD